MQVALATFATYAFSNADNPDERLTADRAFVAISLFNILRFPLTMLPMVINSILQVGVVDMGWAWQVWGGCGMHLWVRHGWVWQMFVAVSDNGGCIGGCGKCGLLVSGTYNMVTCLLQASVSVKRLSNFLQNIEVDPDMIEWMPVGDCKQLLFLFLLFICLWLLLFLAQEDYAIRVKDACFSWDLEKQETPTLSE